MRTILAIAILLTVAITGHAAEDTDYKTNGYRNGRYWNEQTTVAKLAFLFGYYEASQVALDRAKIADKQSDEIQRGLMPLGGVSYAEVILSLDKFFAEPLYAHLPVQAALMVQAEQAKGLSASDTAQYILYLLDFYKPTNETAPKAAPKSTPKVRA